MDLSNVNPTRGSLTLKRRIQVFATIIDDSGLALIMELETPAQILRSDISRSRANLTAILADCELRLAQRQPKGGPVYGQFAIVNTYPEPRLYPRTLEQIFVTTPDYIWAMAFGTGGAFNEDSFGIGANYPTQRVRLESWKIFGLTLPVNYGRLTLEISYPDGAAPSISHRSLLPAIDQLRATLPRAYARRYDEEQSRRLSQSHIGPQEYRTVVIPGAGLIAGPYADFTQLRIVADADQFPDPATIEPFLEEFRGRLRL